MSYPMDLDEYRDEVLTAELLVYLGPDGRPVKP